jgi:hypothetical protein
VLDWGSGPQVFNHNITLGGESDVVLQLSPRSAGLVLLGVCAVTVLCFRGDEWFDKAKRTADEDTEITSVPRLRSQRRLEHEDGQVVPH